MPIDSPVDFISGPRTTSLPGKRAKGSTASLTATCRSRGSVRPKRASGSPAMTRAAIFATGTDVTFATNGTVRVTRMHPRLLDLLHHTGDVDVDPVRDGVNVDLDGAVQELVDEHRIGSGDVRRFQHTATQRVDVLHELHRPSAEDVGRPQEHGV